MWIVKYLLMLIMVLAVLGFSIMNNYQLTTVNVFGKQYSGVPLMVIMYVAFAAGVVFWFIISLFQYFRLTAQVAESKRKNKQLLDEIKTLRNMPLDEVNLQDLAPESHKGN